MADPITGLSVTVFNDSVGQWRWTAVDTDGAPLADGTAGTSAAGARTRSVQALGSLLRSSTVEPDHAVATWLAGLDAPTAEAITTNAARLREINAMSQEPADTVGND